MTDPHTSAVPPGIVRQLEGYGYKPEVVCKWSKARAVTVLRTTEREERIAQYKLAATRGEAPDEGLVGEPLDIERLAAAEWLEEALAGSPMNLAVAVMYATGQLRAAEARRLAEHMIGKFREGSGGRRDRAGRPAGAPAAAAAGGDRG